MEIALELDIQFPTGVSWNFLRQSVFADWSHEEIHDLSNDALRTECHRLGIPIGTGGSKRRTANRVIEFIQNNGLTKTMDRAKRPQGVSYLDPEALLKELHGQQHPTKGLRRLTGVLDNQRPVLFIICSRDSGGRANFEKAHATTERVLREGQVFGQVEKAEFVHVYLLSHPFTKGLVLNKRCKGKGQDNLRLALKRATKDSQIIFVCLGIDGTSGNLTSWRDLVDKYQFKNDRGLELFIAFAEYEVQWHRSSTFWDEGDWIGPIESRMWCICKLSELVDSGTEDRLCQQIQEEWERSCRGRVMRSRAIFEEERPITGRGGKRRKKEIY